MAIPQEALQFFPFPSLQRERPTQSRHLEIDPERPDVVRQLASPQHPEDGYDTAKVCARHQYASPFGPWDVLPVCPLCLSEAEAAPGRARYADITTRLVLGL